ncbi:YhgE/Pip family protein [Staphylococcus caprae]|uniref:YhgE/Pip family protein n=1 Tax=Staphylococcus caprae TaxID=29380 RepID=UPI002DBD68A4|nr:YhgE/Pip family protein [Staphylococcus caprae]MEB8095860.1 YhgE/Pip family protein [Staphylococcus caprae]
MSELKLIKKNKIIAVALLIISIIPMLYIAIFIGSFWNPYDKTDNLSIGVVNKDNKSYFNKNTINVGKDMSKELKKVKTIDFQFMSEKDAERNLKNGKTIGTIIIPKDTSKRAKTFFNKNPKPIEIETRVNPASSYSGSQIAQNAMNDVSDKMSLNIRKKYFNKMSDDYSKNKKSMQSISNSLNKIYDAQSNLILNNQRLTTNMKNDAIGSQSPQIINGNNQITEGLKEINNNTNNLKLSIDDKSLSKSNSFFGNKNVNVLNQVLKVKENNVTTIDSYGEAILPYMISVSLFVGGIAFSSVYPIRKSISKDTSAIKQTFGKLVLYSIQGTLSTVFLSIWVLLAFKLTPDSYGRFLIIGVLWSIVSICITTFFTLLFDKVGLFLAIILLMLQLSASEGIFPITLSGKFYQLINPLSPMSYAIQGYRDAIFKYGSHLSFYNIIIVLVSITIFLILLQYIILVWFNRKEKLPFSMRMN